MSTEMQITLVILAYMGLTVFIGLMGNARKRKQKEKSNDEFLMAGKSLSPIVLAATLFAANTGGASTMGVANNVRIQGLSAAWWVIAAGIGFFLVSFIAPYFRRSSANTVPGIVGLRYGKASHIFTAFTSIAALFMATGAQIIATASIVSLLSGIDFTLAAVLTTVAVLMYTLFGGFKAVASANTLHLLTIVFGMTIAMFLMVNHVGGFGTLFAQADAMSAANAETVNLLSMSAVGVPAIFGFIAMYCFTFPTGQEIVQGYCSAKDARSAKLGSIIAAAISAAYAIVPALIGLVAVTFIPGFLEEGGNAMAEASLAFSHPIIAGIVLASIVAATVSSASGNMIGTATMFTNDVFRPYIKKGVQDDKKEVLVSQISMLVVGLVALTVAIVARNLIAVMMMAFALRSAGPFAAFICGLFYKNVTARAGFVSITVGTAIAVVWIFILGTPFGLNAMVPGGVGAFITIFLVSAIDRKLGVKPLPMLTFEDN